MRCWHNIVIFCLALVWSVSLLAQTLPQTGDAAADAFVVRVTQNRWQVSSACLTFSGNEMYLSAKYETDTVFNIYRAKKQNGQWQMPQKEEMLSSELNDLTPVISPDERTLYLVRTEVKNRGTRKEKTESNLFTSSRLPGADWSEAIMMVIASGTDSDPVLLRDGRTLCYTAKLDKDRKAQFKRYYIRKMDKYNWTLPVEVPAEIDERSLSDPMMEVRCTITNSLNHQPLQAAIDVYNAITLQRVAAYQTAEDGRLRLALSRGMRYKLDIHAPGCSHVYDWRFCEYLRADSVADFEAALTPQLAIKLRTFDKDNMASLAPKLIVKNTETGIVLTNGIKRGPLGDYTMNLPIGYSYSLSLSLRGYVDTVFTIDTRRDVRFEDTELDVLMRGSKTRLEVRSVDVETGEPVPTTMQVVNKSQEEEPLMIQMPEGRWQSTVHCASDYQLLFSTSGYFFCDTLIETPDDESQMIVIVAQHPIRSNEVIQLRDIHFEFSSYLLTEDSYEELSQLAELMRKNPTIRLEISAHTDNVGSDAFNQKLSEQRGASVVEYLVEEEGIAAERLESKGYGKSRPLVDNDTEENRAVNRRVEFTIIEL